MLKSLVFLVILSLIIEDTKARTYDIEKRITEYFSSSIVKNFHKMWQKSRKAYETTVAAGVRESYGSSGGTMNVYVKRQNTLQDLAEGFYFTDNIVHFVLNHVFLRELPHFLDPDVSLSLANNVIRLETKLSKIFIDANYKLLRNRSDIIYGDSFDPTRQSPFVLQQVQTTGMLTIVGEGCHLIGQAVVSLVGWTPHVSHTMFRVVDCKFSIEIYKPGLPTPPVIAPYFSKDQSYQLYFILTEPLSLVLATKMQGSMISLINNTAIFGDDLYKFRSNQKRIFKECAKYMALLVRELNKATIRLNQGIMGLDRLDLAFDDSVDDPDNQPHPTSVGITATINGLDNAYASLTGGPIKMASNLLVDEIRYSKLQVRGKLTYENSTDKGHYDFAVEILDVPVSIQIEIGEKGNKTLKSCDVERNRDLIYVAGNKQLRSLMPGNELIIGYLLNEIPKTIVKLLESVFNEAILYPDISNMPYVPFK